jgi:hypothetical protein
MSLTKIKVATFLVAAATATGALTMSPQQEAAFKQNCTGDYMRFCSMFDPNTPQVEQCFQQRMKELSPRCQSSIASFAKTNPEGRKR